LQHQGGTQLSDRLLQAAQNFTTHTMSGLLYMLHRIKFDNEPLRIARAIPLARWRDITREPALAPDYARS
jgi:hypothetical protein